MRSLVLGSPTVGIPLGILYPLPTASRPLPPPHVFSISNFQSLVSSILGVFLVMVVGAVCRRRGWLSQESDRSLANLTANVLLPAYFIHKIAGNEEFDSLTSAWAPPIFGFASTAFGFAIAYAFARIIGPKIGIIGDAKQRAFALCVGICNYGYIPFPLAEKFYPDAMLNLILHNVGVDLALWSVGIAIISQSATGNWRSSLRRALTSAPLIAVVVASALRVTGVIHLIPDPIMTAIGRMGGCAVPMGLLLGGAIIIDFIGSFRWKGSLPVIISAIGIRQVLMPVLMLGITGGLASFTTILSPEMSQVMLLQAAMPVAIFPIVLVRLHERDTQTAIEVIISTSLAGLITIPLWLAIGSWWLGL